jgi:hypothetical protein
MPALPSSAGKVMSSAPWRAARTVTTEIVRFPAELSRQGFADSTSDGAGSRMPAAQGLEKGLLGC